MDGHRLKDGIMLIEWMQGTSQNQSKWLSGVKKGNPKILQSY
jgi:hypothetical protein